MMNMKGGDMERIIANWTRRGTLSSSEERQLRDIVATCPECASRYRALLPFIAEEEERNVLRESFAASVEDLEAITDRIMTNLDSKKIRRFPSVPGLLKAAAPLVLLFSLIFLLFRPHSDTQIVEVRFFLEAPEAHSVFLVGDFNAWDESGLRLQDRDGDGIWEMTVRLEKNNLYMYNFIIDGEEWISDPHSPSRVEDGFGGTSSMIRL